ncbi:MAG TPA: serine hydrolase [Gemmatimonadales bacterium]|nr:serine hydrolase [Gemmatimonadales bacterium]
MMVRIAQRLTFIAVVLSALAAAPIPASAQAPAATAAPTLEARLERLAAEIERNRIDQHAPGAAVAVVRGGELIFARGFGLANIADKTAVTPGTRFFIGSTTKAFTATLVGMLVDEGLMRWDDPADQHLPYFTLAVNSDDPAARATVRDLLSHRTGFPRMSMLLAGGALSSEEILRQASQAEPLSKFRQRFHYNNEQYLAAGWAAAAAAGRTWDELTRSRILTPLGMTNTETSARRASAMPDLARGYIWHKETGTNEEPEQNVRGISSLDRIGPAGSISSTALDMAKWLRFLLAKGQVNGKPLIRAETLAETWTRQIAMNASLGYGMGWMLREWRGQPLILHEGQIPGQSAMVALLPKSDLGIVVLVNQNASLLGGLAVDLVPSILLGDAPAQAGGDAGDVSPYLGRYVANFATFSNEIFTVQTREGGLALNIPSQTLFALNPPDAQGRWQFALTDQIAVSFRRNGAGEVVAINVHQQGMTFEALREGVEEAPEIDLARLQKYLGTYRSDTGLDITTFIQNQRLAIRIRGTTVLDLHPPDAEGRWAARANAQVAVVFDESDTGEVTGLRFFRPAPVPVMKLAAVPRETPALPTIAELLALGPGGQRDRQSARTVRTTGTVRFPQSAVTGRFQIVTAGDDRLRTDINLGRLGTVRTALNGDRGWVDNSFGGEPTAIRGEMLEQMRLTHPSVLFGDWRRHYDSVAVLRQDKLDGKPVYVVELRKKGLPNVTLRVDAESGDLLALTTTLVMPGLGPVPSTTRFEDYRLVDGARLPFRQVESNEQLGRTVYEIERVELDVEIENELFVLR